RFSLHPSGNPILRLYELFGHPGVKIRDDARSLGVDDLDLRSFGSAQAQDLIQFLRKSAPTALRVCQLTLEGLPILNFLGPVEDQFDWDVIDHLAEEGLLSEECEEVLADWQQDLEVWVNDGVWLRGEDPATDRFTVLDDLITCASEGQVFALELRADKAELVQEHLLSGLPGPSAGVSGWVWRNPEAMQRSFDTFRGFLSYAAQALKRPVALFFFDAVAPYPGDFFQVLSLHTSPDTQRAGEADFLERLQAFTPQIFATFDETHRLGKSERRTRIGDLWDLSPAFLLRQSNDFASYPAHPLFAGGPLRSLVVYMVMAWLAESTQHRDGITYFALPSSGEVPLEFSQTDVTRDGTSLFQAGVDWPMTLLLVAHDIYRSAGRELLRDLWTRALRQKAPDDFAAARFFTTLEEVREAFVQLEQTPHKIEVAPPDVELRIFMKRGETERSVIEFELRSDTKGYFAKSVGSSPATIGDEWVYDMDKLAAHHLEPILPPLDLPEPGSPGQEIPPVDLFVLEGHGRDLWDKLIPEELKAVYEDLREPDEDLTLLIIAKDASFPWELIKPYGPVDAKTSEEEYEDPWWALKLNLGRWLAVEWLPASELKLDRVCCVANTSDLHDAYREVEYFEKANEKLGLGPPQIPQTTEEVLTLLKEQDFDVVHFSCHGRFDQVRPGESVIQLPDGKLLRPNLLNDPALQKRFRQNRPLVFLNSCHSGRVGSAITGLKGWAERFIGMGCGAFIGCGWEVSDSLAAEFAVAFYEGFRGGKTLGKAVQSARTDIMEEDTANSTWLAYYLYGNPNCRYAPP
ncbi:CHAT domain-containing protein, partial [Chloroflexota bacterium]